MAKAFSVSALESYHTIIGIKVDEFMESLRESALGSDKNHEGVFDMASEWNNMMFDIMGALCLGESFGFIAGKGKKILHDVHLRARRVFISAHSPWFTSLGLDKIFFPSLVRANTGFFTFAKKQVFDRIRKFDEIQHVREKEGYYDILGYLLAVKDEEAGDGYTDHELLSECTLLIIAGSGTSASALTATLFYLARNRTCLRTLKSELKSVFQSYEDIKQGTSVLNLKYLRACIDEAMRLSPPAPTNLVRIAGPGGAPVLDKNIPEGYYVGCPNFALFRNGKYFNGPNKYSPDRWMEDNALIDPKAMTLQKKAFEPFSLGPRHCIGKHLAMSEVTFALARVIYTFDIEPVGGSGVSDVKLSGTASSDPVLEQWDTYTSVEPHCGVILRRESK